MHQELRDLLPADEIFILDWGVLDPVRVLSRGRLPVRWGADSLLKNPPGEEDLKYFRLMIQTPGGLFVQHTLSHEEFRGVSAQFGKLLEAEGYRLEMLRTVPDTNGRPVFEVFRVQPVVRIG